VESEQSRARRVLEFGQVLGQLAELTAFAPSRELALSLEPAATRADAERRLSLAAEARWTLDATSLGGVGGVRDIRGSLERARAGGRLEAAELLDVASTVTAGRIVRRAIVPHRERVPGLFDLVEGIRDHSAIEDAVSRAIDARSTILDSASATLARIRSSARAAHSRLMDRLQGMLSSQTYRDVIQDPIVTSRDGRYVIPIRADEKGKVRAIVHDQSSSGATLFVEPLEVVDLNNQIRQLEIEERHEVDRILLALSVRVGDVGAAIQDGLERLARVDLAIAIARLAARHRAVVPELADAASADQAARLTLLAARHPLLRGDVVPIDVHLTQSARVIVITGPNTGGKTVALKTIGLLTLMAQSGLPIPAAEGSVVPATDAVFADIGDEQSIEQSLSTFSSHLTHIVSILREATGRSLVLLDEVGSGTDPVEGAALARTILEELRTRGCLAAATTHYAELKVYAHTTAGVVNASVEFDIESLCPTYRLTIGAAGRSNAMDIATRLGLDPALIERARAAIGSRDRDLSSAMEDLRKATESAGVAQRSAEEEHRRVSTLAATLVERIDQTNRERRSAVERAYRGAQRDLEGLRQRIGEIATSARAVQGSPHISSVAREIRKLQRDVDATVPEPETRPAFKVGDWVRHTDLGMVGQVLRLDAGAAEIQIGTIRSRANLARLTPATRADATADLGDSNPARHSGATVYRTGQPASVESSQVDIRGWRAADVAADLDRILNDAYLAGLPWVRVIHGKGTGALRDAVQEFLAEHPLVSSYRSAAAREGGEGATLATLVGSA